MDDARLPILMENKLLQGLTEVQLRQVLGFLKSEEFAAGASIIRQSEPPQRVYLLAQGRVQVCRSLPGEAPSDILELGPGSILRRDGGHHRRFAPLGERRCPDRRAGLVHVGP